MKFFKIAATAIALVFNSGAFGAEESEFNKARFAGWSGVAASCSMDPVNNLTTSICSSAREMLLNMADKFDVNVILVDGNEFKASLKPGQSFERNHLHVEIKVLSDSPQYSPLGIYFRLEASEFHSAAVDNSRQTFQQPRPGSLITWRSEFVGAASHFDNVDLAAVGQPIEAILRSFLSAFAEANSDK